LPKYSLSTPAIAAVVRWSALAVSPPLWLLFPLQTLHALSYAATFFASSATVCAFSAIFS
jgi:PPP family 3-phenylpropionic acid transporter